VYAWVTDLIAAWRGERIVLSSPMPLEVARRRLSGDPSGGATDVVRRPAATLNTRSAWRPVLRGRLRPAGSGSEFVGVLGWDPALRALTCCQLGASAAVLVAGAVVAASHGWRPAGPAPGLTALGLFGVLVSLASIVLGYRETRGQTASLRSWITGSMHTPWQPGEPGRHEIGKLPRRQRQ
jgi:hypothetical protein